MIFNGNHKKFRLWFYFRFKYCDRVQSRNVIKCSGISVTEIQVPLLFYLYYFETL